MALPTKGSALYAGMTTVTSESMRISCRMAELRRWPQTTAAEPIGGSCQRQPGGCPQFTPFHMTVRGLTPASCDDVGAVHYCRGVVAASNHKVSRCRKVESRTLLEVHWALQCPHGESFGTWARGPHPSIDFERITQGRVELCSRFRVVPIEMLCTELHYPDNVAGAIKRPLHSTQDCGFMALNVNLE